MLNKTRYAILGILAYQPASGYDIKQYCDSGIASFWHENYGHLYPMLHQMTLDGDITVCDSAASGRRRMLYQITEQGRNALRDWLAQPVETAPARLELLLKLSFAKYGSPARMLDLLQDIRQKHAGRLADMQKQERNLLAADDMRKNPGLPYWQSIIRYGIMDAEFRLNWCDETINRLRMTVAAEDQHAHA